MNTTNMKIFNTESRRLEYIGARGICMPDRYKEVMLAGSTEPITKR
jgi:hypothetical protein